MLSLADDISINVNELTDSKMLKSKVPLKQIVQLVERIQKQNATLQMELERVKSENDGLSQKASRAEFLEFENERLNAQIHESFISSEQFLKLSKEKETLEDQVEILSAETNYLPVLQQEIQIAEELKRQFERDLKDAIQDTMRFQKEAKEMENNMIAAEAKLDANVRDMDKIVREKRELLKKNQELEIKLDLATTCQKLVQESIVAMDTFSKENMIASQKSLSFSKEQEWMREMSLLKKENRKLMHEKLMLESELLSRSFGEDDSQVQVLRVQQDSIKIENLTHELKACQMQIGDLKSELDLKNESIDNLILERDELYSIKESLNDQVNSKIHRFESFENRLLTLKETMVKELDSFEEWKASNLNKIPSAFSDANCQTESNQEVNQEVLRSNETSKASNNARIQELESEVKSLSLYITKMVARVSTNDSLQAALFGHSF